MREGEVGKPGRNKERKDMWEKEREKNSHGRRGKQYGGRGEESRIAKNETERVGDECEGRSNITSERHHTGHGCRKKRGATSSGRKGDEDEDVEEEKAGGSVHTGEKNSMLS